MTGRLAGLVGPDNTPVESAASEPEDKRRVPARPGGPPPPAVQGLGTRLRERLFGDWIIVAGGLTLALLCALFPWYIFMHQDEFGIRPLRFESSEAALADSPDLAPEQIGERTPFDFVPPPALDDSPTATVSDADRGASPDEQPFPGDVQDFSFVYAGSGRALIEDGEGFWIVERGARLPDGSRVETIEQRSGQWVLVTSLNTVVSLAE